MTVQETNGVLRAEGLTKIYQSKRGPFTAVNNVSLQIKPGEVLAVVGESGCGKSTLSRLLLGLDHADSGFIRFDDHLLYQHQGKLKKHPTNNDLAIVFQDPYSSLNPKMVVRELIAEAFAPSVFEQRDRTLSRRQFVNQRVVEYLNLVGMGEQHLNRYPHEFSGGQLQRIAFARALAQQPKVLVLDEPTAALDVSVQAQILMLLKELQQRLGLSMLFISHDLGSVSFVADRIVVMYFGNLVEEGPTRAVLDHPRHHYTRALIDAVPSINPNRRKVLQPRVVTEDSGQNDGGGCAFSNRCPAATADCHAQRPPHTENDLGHRYACFYPLPESTL